jgi:uncharacterized protein YkwD
MFRAFLLLALFTLSACAGMPDAPPLPREQITLVQSRLAALLRDERMKQNAEAKPLNLDPELIAAAQAHSDAMARAHAFDRAGAGDNIAIQRLVANPKFRGYVGENSAMQYFTPQAGVDPEAAARLFLEIWLNSAEHRSHILFPGFDRFGIGVSANGNEIYATALFATDLGLPEPP